MKERASGSLAATPALRPATARGFQGRALCYTFLFHTAAQLMIFSKEYVGYLAREVTKRLIASQMVEAASVPAVT